MDNFLFSLLSMTVSDRCLTVDLVDVAMILNMLAFVHWALLTLWYCSLFGCMFALEHWITRYSTSQYQLDTAGWRVTTMDRAWTAIILDQ